MDQLIVQRYFLQVNQTAFNTPVILLFLILYILFKVTRCACKLLIYMLNKIIFDYV